MRWRLYISYFMAEAIWILDHNIEKFAFLRSLMCPTLT